MGLKQRDEPGRTYKFGASSLTVRFGDITTTKADVIVSSDDAYISMGGGVSASILRAGGQEIIIDASKKVPASLGGVVVTTAGRLPASYIFHAITIGRGHEPGSPQTVLQRTIPKCFDLLEVLGLHSIAFPAIGAGAAGFDYEAVAIEMANIIAPRMISSSVSLDVTIYLYDRFGRMQQIDFVRFFEEFRAKVPESSVQEIPIIKDIGAKAFSSPEKLAEPVPRRHELLVEISRLSEERTKLEERLALLIDGKDNEEQQRIRARLAEIQDRMLRLRAELQKSGDNNSNTHIFISYAHEDEPFVKELRKQLSILKRLGVVEEWYDRDITAGTDWRGEIDDHLNSAQLVLLLVSPDFIDSDYCYDKETTRAMERHEDGKTRVIPVILRPCMWDKAPFARLQALPTDGKPVSSFSDRDAVFLEIAQGIRSAIESIRAKAQSAKA